MIAFLRGKIRESLPTQVSIDVHGVGYEVLIPVSSFHRLPSVGGEVELMTRLIVREDGHTLYGFATSAERDLFDVLVQTVTGIGPRIALKILSGMDPAAFHLAVRMGDLRALSQISGVGKKMAERIVLELRDKVPSTTSTQSPGAPTGGTPSTDRVVHDAVLALVALGFRQPEAFESIRAIQAVLGPGATVEDLVRASLKKN